jgi:hypothetical protein
VTVPSQQTAQWNDAELAARVAFQMAQELRQQVASFECAMQNAAIAAALRAHGKAWLRQRQQEQP